MICPICGKDGCKTYPLMVENFLAGKNVDHWRRVHDRMNSSVEYPSLVQQVKNLGMAAFNFAKDGFKTVDEVEQSRRLEICKGCEFFDAVQNRCKKCGCYMKWKTMLSSQKCPIDKW